MEFGFGTIYFRDVFGPQLVGFLAQKAEELAFESLWAPEHVAFPLTWNSRCETEDGEFPEEAGAPWPSPLLPLAYAAASHRSQRLIAASPARMKIGFGVDT